MDNNKELVRVIEKLGDDLGNIIRLSESIYETIEQKYGINANTLGIWQLRHSFQSANENYTKFHKYFFMELGKEAK